MKNILRKLICAILSAALILAAASAIPSSEAYAKASIGNGIILSEDFIALPKNGSATFTAMLGEGFDASRLTCVVADPNVASAAQIAISGNVAAFQVDYVGLGSTVIAVFHMDNPAVIAYATIDSMSVTVKTPPKLGSTKKNYCTLVGYEFAPYDFTYRDFNDYKSVLKLQYKCAAYGDKDFRNWGCYGYFKDAAGNTLGQVRLYAGSLALGRIYTSEFNVPVNAASFEIEGF